MNEVRAKLSKGGLVAIPAQYCEALGWQEGDELTLHLDDGGVRMTTVQAAIRQAQALIRRYVSTDRSLVDELIKARRLESRAQ